MSILLAATFLFGCSAELGIESLREPEAAPVHALEESSKLEAAAVFAAEESLAPKKISEPEANLDPEVSVMSAVEEIPPVISEDQVWYITPQLEEQIADRKEKNSDTIGWLVVPGTTVDTAIVQNPSNDNNYYLTHDFNKRPSKSATYCVDRRCDFSSGDRRDLSIITTLYAHSFDENPNGELFSQLKKYKDPEFAKENPYIFFSTEDENMAWEVFAIFTATVDLPYIVPDLEWDVLSNVLYIANESSLYDYDVEITEEDRLLVLSCCTFSVPGKDPLPFDVPNNYRFVVMARLASPYEAIKESASFTINDDPLTPDEIPVIYHSGNDVFMYDGSIYFNAFDFDSAKKLDLSKTVPLGRIKRTDITMDLQDWDAINLDVGTEILRYNGNDDILIAIVDGEAIPYVKYK